MRKVLERLFVLAVLVIGLSCAWRAPLDDAAKAVVNTGLKRAVVSFASARLLNAGLSVAQSAEVSAKPFGFGFSLTLGQAVHPINELVGQFAELMLAACVAFGAMKLLIVIGSAKGVSLLLSFVALWWSSLYWQGKARPSLLSKILLVLFLVRFSVPLVSVGSEGIFQELLAANYETAQAAIDEGGTLTSIKDWLSNPTAVPEQVRNLKQSAERWVGHIIELIVLFLLQTLIVPLFLFWILYRTGLALLDSTRRTQ